MKNKLIFDKTGRWNFFLSVLSLVVLSTVITTSCDEEKAYKEEMYKKVIYLLSGNDNTYTVAYPLDKTESVKYFSIGCGGSLPNSEAVTVTLGPDDVLLDKYNKSNFDIDVAAYAKLLPQDRYEISSYTITIPANPQDQYVKVPVKVRPLGLSPDTTYFIPIAIINATKYEVNPVKYNLLYRVTIENDYAEQKTLTYYTRNGTMKNQSTGVESALTGNKIMQPLTGDKVRIFAGNVTQTQTSTVDDFKKNAIVLQINSNRSVSFSPYGTIEVEALSKPDYNKFSIEKNMNGKDEYCFYLYYRYRTVVTPAAGANPATYSQWAEITETLKKVETD
jgi:hypothetical protein